MFVLAVGHTNFCGDSFLWCYFVTHAPLSEVAAVSLNNVDNLLIENCEIIRNRQDVPVLGFFSAARFIKPYGKVLKDNNFSMKLRGLTVTAATAYTDLINAINNVYGIGNTCHTQCSECHREGQPGK